LNSSIRRSRTANCFYVNVWPDDVHSPFFRPKDRRGDNSKRARDRTHGNTIILLSSHNGHEAGAGRGGPLRGGETWLYEGGIGSPLIVWVPDIMENSAVGTTNGKSIVSSIGLVVSMVELAVATKPVDWSSDGEDMLGVLPGNQNKPRTSALFWRRRSPPGRTATLEDPNRDLAMRDGRWKWLCKLNGSETQFYDVSSDISETDQPRSASF
jgi:arylsulfatase A-like enzyme